MPRKPSEAWRELRVPYHTNGSMSAWGKTEAWKPNTPFADTMTLSDTKSWQWTGLDGRTWVMQTTALADLVRRATIVRGAVSGVWIVRKYGRSTYGLCLAPDGVKAEKWTVDPWKDVLRRVSMNG